MAADLRFPHHLNLGPALSRQEQLLRIGLKPDSEAVLALLQYLRDEAAEYDVISHDKTAAGEAAAGAQAQGAAQALRFSLFELFEALKLPENSDSEDGVDLSKV
jgi:hypothetical protein